MEVLLQSDITYFQKRIRFHWDKQMIFLSSNNRLISVRVIANLVSFLLLSLVV
jgi:hypothetical protein